VKVIFQRINGSTAVFENCASENCIVFGNFIKDHPVGDDQSRLKIRFCATISLMLSKRQYFAIRGENRFRGRLSDILVNWIEQDMASTPGYSC
jgi:hypothetical protein